MTSSIAPADAGMERGAATDEAALRMELCRVGRSLHARGYVHASAGNLSARLADGGFLLTATDASLGTLEPGSLARIGPDGVPRGLERPSKTLALHRAVYAAEPEAGAIVHTHATALVAASLAETAHGDGDDLLPPITPYFVMKVGHVPLVPYRRPGDADVPALVAACIARGRERGAPIRGVVLARLGPVVWHRTPDEAMALLEELEETARLWLQARPAPTPLSPDGIQALREAFGARW
jgi:ribulose-5-phosphate 4-epimerase/fuculose-1-phosphate aldolase